MGDEGGGYWIGRAALNAASQARDGRGPATTLLDLLANPKGGFDQLVSWSSTATVKEIAGLTSFVEHAAGVGDPVAQGILDRAAAELATLVAPLTAWLDDLPAIPVGLFGGLVASGGPLRARVMAALRQHPRVEVEEREITPVTGALLLARRLADASSETTQ
jgi:N-acetylglucosamine kinase-like BadF-type ATPase